jgi:hypothetical protein
MKYLFFFFLSFPFLMSAQGSFAPIGSKWTYEYLLAKRVTPFGLPSFMQSIKNTVIGGRPCRDILVTEIDFTYHLYLYTRNDSVFLYDPGWRPQWKLLYDYSAGPGDTWEIPYVRQPSSSKDTTMTVKVDSVGTVDFCNQTLKAWYISYDTTRFKWGNRIVEWTGNTFTFMPYLRIRPTCPAYLRCYTDSVRICKAVPYRCDTIWASASEPDLLDWSVQPNPANEVLEVSVTDSPIRNGYIQLYHIATGRLECTVQLPESGKVSVMVKNLPPGIYIAAISEVGRVVARKKVMLE